MGDPVNSSDPYGLTMGYNTMFLWLMRSPKEEMNEDSRIYWRAKVTVKAYTSQMIEWEPKDHEMRVVPVTNQAMQLLDDMRLFCHHQLGTASSDSSCSATYGAFKYNHN